MPAEPPPRAKPLISLRVRTSKTARLSGLGPEPAPRPETRTRSPSGVNLRRLAWSTGMGNVCVARFESTSITVTVLSLALAAQISRPSGETSKPSQPRPLGTLAIRQVLCGAPAGGVAAAPGGAPGGGPGAGV